MSNLETILIVILWIIIACFICHKRKWYAEFDNEQHFIVALTIILYTYITNLCYMV
jgi:hypothetical protein